MIVRYICTDCSTLGSSRNPPGGTLPDVITSVVLVTPAATSSSPAAVGNSTIPTLSTCNDCYV